MRPTNALMLVGALKDRLYVPPIKEGELTLALMGAPEPPEFEVYSPLDFDAGNQMCDVDYTSFHTLGLLRNWAVRDSGEEMSPRVARFREKVDEIKHRRARESLIHRLLSSPEMLNALRSAGGMPISLLGCVETYECGVEDRPSNIVTRPVLLIPYWGFSKEIREWEEQNRMYEAEDRYGPRIFIPGCPPTTRRISEDEHHRLQVRTCDEHVYVPR